MIRKIKRSDLFVCVFQYGTSRTQGLYDWYACSAVYEEIWNTELEEWGGVWKSTIKLFKLKKDCGRIMSKP